MIIMRKFNFFNNKRCCDETYEECNSCRTNCEENDCSCHTNCSVCPPGPTGATGPFGPQGPAGGILNCNSL